MISIFEMRGLVRETAAPRRPGAVPGPAHGVTP
jgi:hypothetical protein